jgi:hypothetical protein
MFRIECVNEQYVSTTNVQWRAACLGVYLDSFTTIRRHRYFYNKQRNGAESYVHIYEFWDNEYHVYRYPDGCPNQSADWFGYVLLNYVHSAGNCFSIARNSFSSGSTGELWFV